MGLESTVSIAKVGTSSVRATVPEGIVAFLNLKVGDKLVWQMEVKDSERMAIVTKKARIKEELDEETRRLASKHVKPEKVRNHRSE
jgi:hypothetical protein